MTAAAMNPSMNCKANQCERIQAKNRIAAAPRPPMKPHRLWQNRSRDDDEEKPKQIGLLNATFPFVMADPFVMDEIFHLCIR